MEKPLVSIVIPCYNQAEYLPDAIESALAQTYENVEVIVVNDGSTDNTSEVARKYPVKLIEQENKGLSAARNAGIKEAKGEYILPLDADDEIRPFYLEETVGKGDIVGVGWQCFGENYDTYMPIPEPTMANFLDRNQITCCTLFKKEVWDKIWGYDETMKQGYEDWDFWLRALNAGYRITTIQIPLFYYRVKPNSMVVETRKHHDEIYNYMINKLNLHN